MSPTGLWLVLSASSMAALAVAVRRVEPVPPPPGGTLLRPERGAAVVGWALASVGVATLWLIVLPLSSGTLVALVGGGLLMAAIAAYGVRMVLAHRLGWLRVDREGLTAGTIRGQTVQLPWPEVARVRYSVFRGALVFDGRDGTRLVASTDLDGFMPFARTVARRLRGRGGPKAVRLGR